MPVEPILLLTFGEMMHSIHPLGWSRVYLGENVFKLENHLNGETLTIPVAVNNLYKSVFI